MPHSGITYGLLVGIDAYQPPVPPLRGCVNDIDRIAALLHERVQREGGRLELSVLRNAQATRQAVIDGFHTHLAQARSDDVALFYFSGHGSQSLSPPEFWHLEPDHLDETLVCYDSRQPGGWDLADKELAILIKRVARNDAHIILILDACHSGSGTRNLDDTDLRRVSTDLRPRPFESFLDAAQWQRQAVQLDGLSPSGWFDLPIGRHVVLSACRAEEEARESSFDGERRGVFSYYLLASLQQLGPSLSYRDLFRRVEARVRGTTRSQSPQIEATNNDDLDRAFLGGAIGAGRPSFVVRHDATDGWLMDVGAVHGLVEGGEGERTVVALFADTATAAELGSASAALGTATVASLRPGQSLVTIDLRDGTQPVSDQVFKAVVVSVPLPPLPLEMAGDAGALELVREALTRTAGSDKAAPALREARPGQESAAIHLLAQDGRYSIRRAGDSSPLAVTVEQLTAEGAERAIACLEHVGRWLSVLRLSNPTTNLPAGAVRVELFAEDGATPLSAASLALAYTTDASGNLVSPKFRLRLTNTTDRPLYCLLLNLTESYKISAALLREGRVRLGPQGTAEATAWANSGKPIALFIPKPLREQGIRTLRDWVKLIVSTADADGRLLEQPELSLTVLRDAPKGLAANTALGRLMREVTTRDVGEDPNEQELFADWQTSELLFSVTLPADGVAIPASEHIVAELAQGVQLVGHAGLRARARLVGQDEASRGIGSLALPALLRDHPELSAPFELTTSRVVVPSSSVLELFFDEQDGASYQEVSAERPLVLRTQAMISEGEGLLALAFDGEFFLPLGSYRRMPGATEIRLERLPHPSSEGKRSLGGAIKVYFQKLLSERLAVRSEYPRLALPSVGPDASVSYDDNPSTVAAAVAEAESVLLFIHGIIGDTAEMARLTRGPEPAIKLSPGAVVLTFDYESLSTKIERTARDLKAKLGAVGLGPGHAKKLHIVAHSMGGLVARWLIEKEDGKKQVQRLTMLGTPNGGSPWPNIQDWATMTIGIGINFIGSVAWPVQALGWLVGALEAIDEPLDQMKAGSDLLTALADSDDPQVPYTVLAGNTSVIEAVQRQAGAAGALALGRLLERLTPGRLLHGVTALAFLSQANDIAVSVYSIKQIPNARSPAPELDEIPCDHLTYFSSAEGAARLNRALEVS